MQKRRNIKAKMLSLQDLFAGLQPSVQKQIPKADRKLWVSVITSDSREVRPGSVFVAVKGSAQDGHRFIPQAIQQGAILVVSERDTPSKLLVPCVRVRDTRAALAALASAFYGHPSRAFKVIGVTGTSGKTTTTHLLESILKAAGEKVGVIGTINTRFGGKEVPSQLTTPGPVELQRLCAEMCAQGCTALVMEVSSHALKQKRVGFIAFDAVVFTNLSPEHLDFHSDMEDYFAAKKLLFTEALDESIRAGKRPVAVVCADDPYGKRLARLLRARASARKRAPPVFLFSVLKEEGLRAKGISGQNLRAWFSGIEGKIGKITIKSSLTGQFNILNILGSVAVARCLRVPPAAISKGIARLKAVPGRLERVPNAKGIHVLVDYAHKPDALEKVLEALRALRATAARKAVVSQLPLGRAPKIITVFGCGGDRDRTKRPVMGRIACALSDHVFITSDNPRTEDPQAIIAEILQGTASFSNFSVEPDRRKAIFAAIQSAAPSDLVLIAGKGHEDYQIIADPAFPGGTRKIHFDDRKLAREVLKFKVLP